MSSLQILASLLAGAIPVCLTLVVYFTRNRARHLRLRYLYERFCMCLTEDQIEARREGVDPAVHSLFPAHHYLTAMEFLQEPGPGGRRLMAQLDKFSPSLFAAATVRLLAIALAASLPVMFGTFLIFVLLVPSAVALMTSNVVAVLFIGGLLGVASSFGCIFFVYRVHFDRNVEDVRIIAQRWPVWGMGATARPNGRPIIIASADPDFSGLS